MLTKLLNAVLLIAAVIGGVLAHRAGMQHQQLLTEFRRLEKKVGHLPIEDPTKVYVRALKTDEELHFAWRVYLPAGFNVRWQNSGGGSSWSSNSNAGEFIARVRFRQNDRGVLSVFTKQRSGSGMMGLGNRQLADMLRGRWSEIRVEQLGADDVVVVEPDEVATLLRLTLSDGLKQEAERKLNKYLAKRFQAVLFDLCFGSDKAFK